jgi:hypothetical protein
MEDCILSEKEYIVIHYHMFNHRLGEKIVSRGKKKLCQSLIYFIKFFL